MDNTIFSENLTMIKQEFEDYNYLDNVFVSETAINANGEEKDYKTDMDLIYSDIKKELSPDEDLLNNTVMDNKIKIEHEIIVSYDIKHFNYLGDDKVFARQTAISTDGMELNKLVSDDQMKLDLVCSDIKQESLSSDVDLYNKIVADKFTIKHKIIFTDTKAEFNNKQLLCRNCNERYEDYCIKCDMLLHILNGNSINNGTTEEIPRSILQIKEHLGAGAGIFALKAIPKGVKLGPFMGLSGSESSWRIKGGKFLVNNDESKFLNWMQYINSARSVFEQNLSIFQYGDILYYRSIREIQKGEELLVYFGEENDNSMNNDVEMDFIPPTEIDIENVFACTLCCLGFSANTYLAEHKTVCPNGTIESAEELTQCPFCKIYLEEKEYSQYHRIYCCKRNARHCVLPLLDIPTLDENTMLSVVDKGNYKNHTNGHKDSDYKCMECVYTTNYKATLEEHIKAKHLKESDYKCIECKYKTNYKIDFEAHVRMKHLRPTIHKHLKTCEYKCMECEYQTNFQSSLERHKIARHLKEKRYKCMECDYQANVKLSLERHKIARHLKGNSCKFMGCEYKTYCKLNLKLHIKTKHLKQYDYKCNECEFKTNYTSNLIVHIKKTKHLVNV